MDVLGGTPLHPTVDGFERVHPLVASAVPAYPTALGELVEALTTRWVRLELSTVYRVWTLAVFPETEATNVQLLPETRTVSPADQAARPVTPAAMGEMMNMRLAWMVESEVKEPLEPV